jgi:hypothetical protein
VTPLSGESLRLRQEAMKRRFTTSGRKRQYGAPEPVFLTINSALLESLLDLIPPESKEDFAVTLAKKMIADSIQKAV